MCSERRTKSYATKMAVKVLLIWQLQLKFAENTQRMKLLISFCKFKRINILQSIYPFLGHTLSFTTKCTNLRNVRNAVRAIVVCLRSMVDAAMAMVDGAMAMVDGAMAMVDGAMAMVDGVVPSTIAIAPSTIAI